MADKENIPPPPKVLRLQQKLKEPRERLYGFIYSFTPNHRAIIESYDINEEIYSSGFCNIAQNSSISFQLARDRDDNRLVATNIFKTDPSWSSIINAHFTLLTSSFFLSFFGWWMLAEKTGKSVEDIVKIMMDTNQLDIKSAIDKFLASSEDLKIKEVYIGFTGRDDASKRQSEHSRLHGAIEFQVLRTYGSKFEGCLAEALGIAYLKSIEHQFRKVRNVGVGWEQSTLQSKGPNFTIYMFLTKTPDGNNYSKGSLQRANQQFEVDLNKLFCLHCQRPMLDSSNIGVHMKLYGRDNLACTYCKQYFTNEVPLNYHLSKNHEKAFHCFKAGCTFVGTLAQFRESHFKQMFDPENPLVQAIINNDEFMID